MNNSHTPFSTPSNLEPDIPETEVVEKESLLVQQTSLCDLLDRVLNKGAVLTGEILISVAGVELLYVGVNLLISSVETLLDTMKDAQREGQSDENF